MNTRKESSDWLSSVALAAAVVAISSFLVCEIYDYDVFWNLVIGTDILANLSVPRVDRYTAAGFGHPYHDIHWLFQVGLALAYRAVSWTGVGLFTIAVWGATFFFTYRAIRKNASRSVAALLLLISAMACTERFLPRPEIVSYLMVSLFSFLLQNKRFSQPREWVVLAALQVIWTNAHGLFVIGPYMVGCYLVRDVIGATRGEKAPAARRLGLLGLLMAVSLVNPHGLGAWRYVYRMITEVGPDAPMVFGMLGELSPTFGTASRAGIAFWFYLALLLMSLNAVGRGIVRREWKMLTDPSFLILVGMTGASLTGRRNVVLLALTAGPFIAAYLHFRLPIREISLQRALTILALTVTLLLSYFAISGNYYLFMKIPARFGFGVTPSFFPHDLPPFLDRIGFGGQVFNSNNVGGYYMYRRFPKQLPLSDGRWETYDQKIIARVLVAPEMPPVFDALVREYDIRGLLLQHSSPEAAALLPRLLSSTEWKLVYCDYAVSFWAGARHYPDIPRLRVESDLNLDRPRRKEDALILDSFLRAVGAVRPRISNVKYLLEFPDAERDKQLEVLGGLQLKLGLYSDAEFTFLELQKLAPNNVNALNELAYLAALRNDVQRALALLREALQLDPGNAQVRENMERLLGQQGRP